MKSAERFVVGKFFRCGFGGGAGGTGVKMNEGVEFWLERRDASEFVVEEFERRKLFGAEEFGEMSEGSVVERRHGPSFLG